RAPHQRAADLTDLRREPAVVVLDGAEGPVCERVVVDVEREVCVGRDLETDALAPVADADDCLVRFFALHPEERYLDATVRAVGELRPRVSRRGGHLGQAATGALAAMNSRRALFTSS